MKTTAVILAAGMGKRLGEHTQHIPKALIEVGGKPLIAYALEYVRVLGADTVYVVGGYHYEQLVKVVKIYDSTAVCIENPRYTLQNLVSFHAALPYIDAKENLLVANVDYIFHQDTLIRMKDVSHGAAVFCSYDLSGDADDVMKVSVDASGNMVAMSKTLTEFQAIYTGYWYIESSQVDTLKKTTAHLVKTTDLEKTTVEEIFQSFVQDGMSVRVADVGSPTWLEIDTPEELEFAQKKIDSFNDAHKSEM